MSDNLMRITAGQNGSLVCSVDANDEQYIQGLGVVTAGDKGSQFVIGANSDNQTQVDFYNHSDEDSMIVITDGDINNFSFNGSNFDANLKSQNNTVLMNSRNSKLKSDGDNNIIMGANSHDNITNLGYGNNNIVDDGDYNLTMAHGKTIFASSETSEGAVVITGEADDEVLLNGSHGFAYTGNGADAVVLGIDGQYNVASAAGGKDHIIDNGHNGYIDAGAGDDTVNMNGVNGIAQLGSGNQQGIGAVGSGNYVYGPSVVQPENKKPNKETWMEGYAGHQIAYDWVNELAPFGGTAPELLTDVERAFNSLDATQDQQAGETLQYAVGPFSSARYADSAQEQLLVDNFYKTHINDAAESVGVSQYALNRYGRELAGEDGTFSLAELQQLDKDVNGVITQTEIDTFKRIHVPAHNHGHN